MLNLDDRILSTVDENELWLLLHIAKRMDKGRKCWPANATLLKDTGWQIDKLQKIKKQLIDKKILTTSARKNTSNVYTVHTKLIGVFVLLDGMELEMEENTPTGKTSIPPTLFSSIPPTGKTGIEVLTNEVLINEHGDLFSSSVIDQFNRTKKEYGLGKSVELSKPRQKQILLLQKAGYTSDDLLNVIRHRFEEWARNDKMKKYLTPDTLFRMTNFPKYLEAFRDAPEKDWTQQGGTVSQGGVSNWPG